MHARRSGRRVAVRPPFTALFLLGSLLVMMGVGSAEHARPVRIGVLTQSWGPTPDIVGLHDGLLELGYREDKDFFLGVRFTRGNLAELPVAARELVEQGVDLMIAPGVNAAKAAEAATREIPIVFTVVDEPVAFGLIKSYARPGGNMTGVTDLGVQLGPKRLQLFSEMISGLKRVLFPYDASDTYSKKELQTYRQAARRLGLEVVGLPLRTQAEARAILMQPQDEKVQAFLCPRYVYLNIPGFVLQATREQKIPGMFADVFFVERGGLVSYSPDFYETGRQAARLVDKILKGEKPAELPVEVNSKIDFAINMKTAQALGLTIPPEILFQATKVIR